MEELFKELKKYYFISSDLRENGIHPRCIDIWDQMTEYLSVLNETELVEYLENLPEKDLEIIYPVIEDLVELGQNCIAMFIK